MGFLKKAFKKLKKTIKKVASSPFEMARDVGRGVRNLGRAVGHLSQGDLGGALNDTVGAAGNIGKGVATGITFGVVSDNSEFIDTKVKEDVQEIVAAAPEKKAHVSFADAATPDVILGADEVEEDLMKRKVRKDTRGFLGGLSGSNGSLLI